MKSKAEYILEQWNFIDINTLPMGYGDNRLIAVANKCKCSVWDVERVLSDHFESIVTGKPIHEIGGYER